MPASMMNTANAAMSDVAAAPALGLRAAAPALPDATRPGHRGTRAAGAAGAAGTARPVAGAPAPDAIDDRTARADRGPADASPGPRTRCRAPSAEPDTEAEPGTDAEPDAEARARRARHRHGGPAGARLVTAASRPTLARRPSRPAAAAPALGGAAAARGSAGPPEGVVAVWSRKGSRNLGPARGGLVGYRSSFVPPCRLRRVSHAPSPPFAVSCATRRSGLGVCGLRRS